MFRNRVIQLDVIKKLPEKILAESECNHLDPECIAKMTKDVVYAIGSTILAAKLLDTLCQIAVIAAKAKIR